MAIYVKYETPTINGAVTAEGYEKQLELNSFQWGLGRGIASAVGKSGNREASDPSISEVSVTRELDDATGPLLKEALGGKGGAKLTISFTRTDAGKSFCYLQYILSDAILSGYSESSGGDRPSESLSINFAKIEIKIIPADKDGKPGTAFPVTYDLGLAKLS